MIRSTNPKTNRSANRKINRRAHRGTATSKAAEPRPTVDVDTFVAFLHELGISDYRALRIWQWLEQRNFPAVVAGAAN